MQARGLCLQKPGTLPVGSGCKQFSRPYICTCPGLRITARHPTSRRLQLHSRRVAEAEGPVVEKEPGVQPEEQAEQADAPFSWTKHWYPVAVLADIDQSKPQAIRILGGHFVLWVDSKGEWHCHQDRCPHRLVPLSEGKVVNDTLQCSYHGWRFQGDGACVNIPQATPDTIETVLRSPRSCVTSFPVSLKHGLIWVWPDSSPDRFVVAAAHEEAPEAPPEDGKDGLKWYTFLPWFARTFPYGLDTFFDNTLDPAHVPWSHDGVIGDSTKVTPLELKVVEPVSSKGLIASYSTLGREATGTSMNGKADPATVHIQFQAPHTLVYDTNRDDGSRARLVAYATPVGPGSCMVIAQTWDTRPTWMNTGKLSLPAWLAHLLFLKASDGDMVFLKGQEATLTELPNGWKEFHMPTRADVGVRLWREWLGRFTKGTSMGPYQLAPASEQLEARTEARKMTKEQILDRYNQHVIHCPSCSSALKTFRATTWVAGVAAAVCVQLSLLTVLKLVGPAAAAAKAGAAAATAASISLGPLVVPMYMLMAAGLTAASAALIKLALLCKSISRSFEFEDYVHAHA